MAQPIVRQSITQKPDFTKTLPDELWIDIFKFIPPKEVAVSVALVSYQFQQFTHEKSLWKFFCRVHFGMQATPGLDYRREFFEALQKEKRIKANIEAKRFVKQSCQTLPFSENFYTNGDLICFTDATLSEGSICSLAGEVLFNMNNSPEKKRGIGSIRCFAASSEKLLLAYDGNQTVDIWTRKPSFNYAGAFVYEKEMQRLEVIHDAAFFICDYNHLILHDYRQNESLLVSDNCGGLCKLSENQIAYFTCGNPFEIVFWDNKQEIKRAAVDYPILKLCFNLKIDKVAIVSWQEGPVLKLFPLDGRLEIANTPLFETRLPAYPSKLVYKHGSFWITGHKIYLRLSEAGFLEGYFTSESLGHLFFNEFSDLNYCWLDGRLLIWDLNIRYLFNFDLLS